MVPKIKTNEKDAMIENQIVAFGEIVWDQFDDRTIIGGAPLNVAYHLRAQQWPVKLISRIGADRLGSQTLTEVEQLGLPVNGIQQDESLPTGLVIISLDANNEPTFDIAQPAAWDNIREPEAGVFKQDIPFHIIFGTLAQRNSTSRWTLHQLIERAEKVFYDINLRPPHTPQENVLQSLEAADVVKVNAQELEQLNQWFLKAVGNEQTVGRQLLEKFDLSLLAVTNGSKGASLITADDYCQHPGFTVKVADPVGSGDAFFSGLITGYLNNLPLKDCLTKANKLGSWVASQPGATPRYNKK